MQTQQQGSSLIRIGDDVLDSSGEKLGEISRVIVDARTNTIGGLVVKGTGLFASERIVPRDSFQITGSPLRIDLAAADFEQLEGFDPDAFDRPDPDYSGTPGFDREAAQQANLSLDSAVAMGSLGGIGTSVKPLGYPGGEDGPGRREPAADTQLPVVGRGTDILDVSGEKVGEVDEMAFGPGGEPVSLTVKQGFIFARHTEIPTAWIAEVGGEGVHLNVASEQVSQLAAGS